MHLDQAELQLLLTRPGESLLRMVLDAMPVAASIGIDGKVVYANGECAQMWGFSDGGEMRGKTFFELVAPQWFELVQLVWRTGANRRGPWTYELEGFRLDGSMFPYRITSFGLDLELGKTSVAFFEPINACTPLEVQSERLLHLLEDAG